MKLEEFKGTLPNTWRVTGELPPFTPTPQTSEIELLDFTQDLLQIEAGMNHFIDVGWYPHASPTGQFRCRVIQDEDWPLPIADLETKSLDEVENWLEEARDLVLTLTGTTPK